MGDTASVCASCGTVVAPFGSAYDKALLLSGSAYCPKCLPDLRFACHRCKRVLVVDDFDAGRGMVLLGRKYCDHCLEEAVGKNRHAAEPASPSPALLDESGKRWLAARAHPRFLPPPHCALTVHRQSVFGLLVGDVLRLWVDLSEGGLRAILRGTYDVNDRVKGAIACPPRQLTMEFRGIVRYVKNTDRFPGSMVVGLRFDQPTPEFQSFLREIVDDPSSATPTPRKTQIPKTRAG